MILYNKNPDGFKSVGIFYTIGNCENQPRRFALFGYKNNCDRRAASSGRCPLFYGQCPFILFFVRFADFANGTYLSSRKRNSRSRKRFFPVFCCGAFG
jgi:hypothetical protein